MWGLIGDFWGDLRGKDNVCGRFPYGVWEITLSLGGQFCAAWSNNTQKLIPPSPRQESGVEAWHWSRAEVERCRLIPWRKGGIHTGKRT